MSGRSKPAIERRDDIQAGRITAIQEARQRLQDERRDSQRRHNHQRGYTLKEANTDYLTALQALILELEPLYERVGACPEYWEADIGQALGILERPRITMKKVEQKLDVPPTVQYGSGVELQNREVLAPRVLTKIYSLRELLELEDAGVPYREMLYPAGRRTDPQPIKGEMVISRSTLDAAVRWVFDFCEEIGLTVEQSDTTGATIDYSDILSEGKPGDGEPAPQVDDSGDTQL